MIERRTGLFPQLLDGLLNLTFLLSWIWPLAADQVSAANIGARTKSPKKSTSDVARRQLFRMLGRWFGLWMLCYQRSVDLLTRRNPAYHVITAGMGESESRFLAVRFSRLISRVRNRTFMVNVMGKLHNEWEFEEFQLGWFHKIPLETTPVKPKGFSTKESFFKHCCIVSLTLPSRRVCIRNPSVYTPFVSGGELHRERKSFFPRIVK